MHAASITSSGSTTKRTQKLNSAIESVKSFGGEFKADEIDTESIINAVENGGFKEDPVKFQDKVKEVQRAIFALNKSLMAQIKIAKTQVG
jgi:hypothetical protein